MKIMLRGDMSLSIEFSKHELDAQIQLLRLFKIEDREHALQLDEVLTTLQILRFSRK